MPTWAELIPPYTEYLTSRRLSPRTLQLRLYQLKRLHRDTGKQPHEITLQDLTTALANPNWAENTAATARASYASFFRWCDDFEILPVNPAAKLASVKVPKGKPKPATDSMYTGALERAKPSVALMVRLAALAGLRAMEIATLHSDDVTIVDVRNKKGKVKGRRAFLTIKGKGGKTRIIPIQPDFADELTASHGWIFPGRINGHYSPAYVSKEVSRVLPPGWTCHKLRHRFATRAYRNSGHNLLALQKLMGHASPATTGGYADVDDDDLWATSLSADF